MTLDCIGGVAMRLTESFVDEALPTSWKEYYVVNHHNLEHTVDLVRSTENENDAYLGGDWIDFYTVFRLTPGVTFNLAVLHYHIVRIYFFLR
ncbi:hypothetical protein RIF29_33797 [Crotalaria pallida]|uniref:Uncharacterized protein n=1 Tax=Crotalaria pallida TaxID=3830 RepID=A0AAN9EB10_CROPI